MVSTKIRHDLPAGAGLPLLTDCSPSMVIRRLQSVPTSPTARLGGRDMPEWNDQELLLALSRGDPRAGIQLYDRLIRVVEWTILRIIGQRTGEHEDLVQGAFEQIVVTLHRQRYAYRCSLTSWAGAVSCHVALNALRSRRRQKALHVESLAQQAEPLSRIDPENQLAARQQLQRIRDVLSGMNPARAEALALHEINGLELAEISIVLGISVAAAQSRVSRGRRELMQRLDRTPPEEEQA
jgi:RNA polymerase sigma-70 factor (ECF subfamily)